MLLHRIHAGNLTTCGVRAGTTALLILLVLCLGLGCSALGPEATGSMPAEQGVVVISVKTERKEIAAGALPTDPHQTKITIQLSKPVARPVAVWLEGGQGRGVGEQGWLGLKLNLEGPARIEGDGQTFVAGGAEPSEEAVLVKTDAHGRAVLTLTSSNKIGETANVHARCGSDRSMDDSDAFCSVTFVKGLQEIKLLRVCGELHMDVLVTRKHDGRPLPDHDTVVYVQSVTVEGRKIEFRWWRPLHLQKYAYIDPSQVRQKTGADGRVTARILVKHVPGLDNIAVATRDLQVFE